MHRATVLLRVSTVVAFCADLIGCGAVGAKAEITALVPAGVHWRASPEGMPLWGPNRFWPGSSLVLRCLGPVPHPPGLHLLLLCLTCLVKFRFEAVRSSTFSSKRSILSITRARACTWCGVGAHAAQASMGGGGHMQLRQAWGEWGRAHSSGKGHTQLMQAHRGGGGHIARASV